MLLRKLEGTPTVGTPCTFNFDVSNTGSDYYGLVGLRIENNNVEENVVSLSVARGKKSQISFGYIPKTTGTFKYSLVSIEESYNEATKKWEDTYKDIPGSSGKFTVREAWSSRCFRGIGKYRRTYRRCYIRKSGFW